MLILRRGGVPKRTQMFWLVFGHNAIIRTRRESQYLPYVIMQLVLVSIIIFQDSSTQDRSICNAFTLSWHDCQYLCGTIYTFPACSSNMTLRFFMNWHLFQADSVYELQCPWVVCCRLRSLQEPKKLETSGQRAYQQRGGIIQTFSGPGGFRCLLS